MRGRRGRATSEDGGRGVLSAGDLISGDRKGGRANWHLVVWYHGLKMAFVPSLKHPGLPTPVSLDVSALDQVRGSSSAICDFFTCFRIYFKVPLSTDLTNEILEK